MNRLLVLVSACVVLVGALAPTESSAAPRCLYTVVFDLTEGKFNDQGWYPGDDPMGTLKGGETYTGEYDEARGYTTKGYNEQAGQVGIWTYRNGNLREHQLSLWGRIFVFSDGLLYDPDYGIVGHVTLTGCNLGEGRPQ